MSVHEVNDVDISVNATRDANPEMAGGHLWRAALRIEDGQYQSATVILRDLIHKMPVNSNSDLQGIVLWAAKDLADIALKHGQLDTAEKIYRILIGDVDSQRGDSVDIKVGGKYFHIQLHTLTSRLNKAGKNNDMGAYAYCGYINLLKERMAGCIRRGERQQALKYYEQALRLIGDAEKDFNGHELAPMIKIARAELYLFRVFKFEDVEDMEGFLTTTKKIVDSVSDDSIATFHAYINKQKKIRGDKGGWDLARQDILNRKYFAYASIAKKRGKYEEASRIIAQVVPLKLDDTLEKCVQQAEIYFQLHLFDNAEDAVERYRKAKKGKIDGKDDRDSRYLLVAGNICKLSGRYTDAIALFSKIETDDQQMLVNLAETYFMRGDTALKDLETAGTYIEKLEKLPDLKNSVVVRMDMLRVGICKSKEKYAEALELLAGIYEPSGKLKTEKRVGVEDAAIAEYEASYWVDIAEIGEGIKFSRKQIELSSGDKALLARAEAEIRSRSKAVLEKIEDGAELSDLDIRIAFLAAKLFPEKAAKLYKDLYVLCPAKGRRALQHWEAAMGLVYAYSDNRSPNKDYGAALTYISEIETAYKNNSASSVLRMKYHKALLQRGEIYFADPRNVISPEAFAADIAVLAKGIDVKDADRISLFELKVRYAEQQLDGEGLTALKAFAYDGDDKDIFRTYFSERLLLAEGRIALAHNDSRKALACFRELEGRVASKRRQTRPAPNNMLYCSVLRGLAEVYMLTGDASEALARIEMLLEPKDGLALIENEQERREAEVYVLLQKVRVCILNGEHDEAEKIIKKLAAADDVKRSPQLRGLVTDARIDLLWEKKDIAGLEALELEENGSLQSVQLRAKKYVKLFTYANDMLRKSMERNEPENVSKYTDMAGKYAVMTEKLGLDPNAKGSAELLIEYYLQKAALASSYNKYRTTRFNPSAEDTAEAYLAKAEALLGTAALKRPERTGTRNIYAKLVMLSKAYYYAEVRDWDKLKSMAKYFEKGKTFDPSDGCVDEEYYLKWKGIELQQLKSQGKYVAFTEQLASGKEFIEEQCSNFSGNALFARYKQEFLNTQTLLQEKPVRVVDEFDAEVDWQYMGKLYTKALENYPSEIRNKNFWQAKRALDRLIQVAVSAGDYDAAYEAIQVMYGLKTSSSSDTPLVRYALQFRAVYFDAQTGAMPSFKFNTAEITYAKRIMWVLLIRQGRTAEADALYKSVIAERTSGLSEKNIQVLKDWDDALRELLNVVPVEGETNDGF